MISDDGWDWPWLLYIGTHSTWLGRSEKEFWMMSPRKFFALLKVHVEMMESKQGGKAGKKDEVPFGYIDQIPGW